MKNWKLIFFKVLFLVGVGCASMGDRLGTAFQVRSSKEGGRIMLNGTNSWMEAGSRKKAELDMKENCPKGFEIVEEGLMQRPSDQRLSGYTHVMEKYLEYNCLDT